jgi:NAD-dependent deacetylase
VTLMKAPEDPVRKVSQWLREASRVAVLTGAGISTESGIPDFRSATGLYSDERNANVFDLAAFLRDPKPFYRFAQEFYPLVMRAQPNTAHRLLAQWEKDWGKDIRIATQNVDDFHQRAGSSKVYPVHGDFRTSRCMSCGASSATERWMEVVMRGEVPRCDCGGVIKPDITFFGELLPEEAWRRSAEAMARAELLLILGTSLQVYPAAALPDYAPPSAHIVMINQEPTARDDKADIVLRGTISEALSAISAGV